MEGSALETPLVSTTGNPMNLELNIAEEGLINGRETIG